MKLSVGQIRYPKLIALAFGLIILAGAFLLTLPISSKSGTWTPFIDALFTATSSNCVTGLIVFDTYGHWSLFGQLTILALIQIGGIGFMAVGTFFSLVLRRRIGLNERILMQEAAGSTHVGGVVRLTKRILLATLFFEGIGTILLAIRFIPQMGFGEGLYNGLFHAVSAFCNAGFDIMGKFGQFSSLTTYSHDPYVLFIIAALIVIGGIGFFVWDDIVTHKWRWKNYTLHTKAVLTTTLGLIVIGAVLAYIAEHDNTMRDLDVPNTIANSVFLSISPRTAGFNSVEMGALSGSTVILTIFLMVVGGSPGSTAGGIKTTTLFILGAAIIATLKNRQDITAFKRRIDGGSLRKACAILGVYFGLALLGIIIISLIQSLSLTDTAFEVFSGIGTVGLTLGITRELAVVSKLVIISLMYFGRVGVLSLLFIFTKEHGPAFVSYPTEKILVG